jgi:RNA polymerase-binding transcription factor DksA
MTGYEKYSDLELEEFRVLVEGKLEKARQQYSQLQQQIQETAEGSDDDFGTDWIDDCSVHSQLEMLGDMAARQRKYIHNLENALLRIRNKTYGICEVTGEKIDKRRLLAVPTTTKSLKAKTEHESRTGRTNLRESEVSDEEEAKDKPRPAPAQKVITKIIRKPAASPENKEASRPGPDYDLWPADDLDETDADYFDPEDLADAESEDSTFDLD